MNTQPKSGAASLRATKKLPPESCGAGKLARLLGEALVCARHRSDDKGEYRHTTAELLVERAPIRPRADNLVGIRIWPEEKPPQSVLRAAGRTWDYKAKVWRLPRRVVGILKPADRISRSWLHLASRSSYLDTDVAA